MLWVKFINAFGIFLNLVAGFLIAPELIGVSRIRNMEKRFERWSSETDEKLKILGAEIDRVALSTRVKIKKADFLYIIVIVLVIYLLPGFQYWMAVLQDMFLYLFNTAYASTYPDVPWTVIVLPYYLSASWIAGLVYFIASIYRSIRGVNIGIKKSDLLVLTLFAPIAIPFYLLAGSLEWLLKVSARLSMLFGWVLVFISRSFLLSLITKLEGEERLQSLMIWWGIILFMMGNILQCVAAFL